MSADGYLQNWGSGLCGMVAVLNALRLLFGSVPEDDAGHLQGAMARALEGTGGRDLAAVLFEDGTGRAQVKRMLKAAQAWTDAKGWLSWSAEPHHPKPGLTAIDFWKDVAGALAMAAMRGRACLIVGFGSDDTPNSRYAPHWTCIERVGERSLDLRDSTDYGRVRVAETGIRPEHGWALQDCFVVRRAA